MVIMDHPQTILIADNNETLLQLLKQQLHLVEPESRVLVAQDSFAALAQLQTTPVDVLVVGEQLTGIKPLTLAQMARGLWPNLQIIWLTGHNIAAAVNKAKRKHLVLDACLDKTALLLYLLEAESRELEPAVPGPAVPEPAVLGLQDVLGLYDLGKGNSYEQ